MAAFVAAGPARLADLTPEEREELLGGLEADLSDLLAEGGPGALGDPDAYAAELRAAAGLAARPPVPRPAAPRGRSATGSLELLDAAPRVLGALGGLTRGSTVGWAVPGAAAGLVGAAAPGWRSSCLTCCWGRASSPRCCPRSAASSPASILLALAVARQRAARARSALAARGRASRRAARLLLLGLNLFAVAVLPVTRVPERGLQLAKAVLRRPAPGHDTGLMARDGYVRNLQPTTPQGTRSPASSSSTRRVARWTASSTLRHRRLPVDTGRRRALERVPQAERRQAGDDRARPMPGSARPPAFNRDVRACRRSAALSGHPCGSPGSPRSACRVMLGARDR